MSTEGNDSTVPAPEAVQLDSKGISNISAATADDLNSANPNDLSVAGAPPTQAGVAQTPETSSQPLIVMDSGLNPTEAPINRTKTRLPKGFKNDDLGVLSSTAVSANTAAAAAQLPQTNTAPAALASGVDGISAEATTGVVANADASDLPVRPKAENVEVTMPPAPSAPPDVVTNNGLSPLTTPVQENATSSGTSTTASAAFKPVFQSRLETGGPKSSSLSPSGISEPVAPATATAVSAASVPKPFSFAYGNGNASAGANAGAGAGASAGATQTLSANPGIPAPATLAEMIAAAIAQATADFDNRLEQIELANAATTAALSATLEDERTKSTGLLERATSFMEIAKENQAAHAKSNKEHNDTLLIMHNKLAETQARLDNSVIATSSYIAQLDEANATIHAGTGGFHSAASSAAGKDEPAAAAAIAELDAEMQLLLAGTAKSQATAAVTTSAMHHAQLAHDAAAKQRRDAADAEASRTKLLVEREEQLAAVALATKKNEQLLLQRAAAVRKQQEAASERCDKDKAAAEIKLLAQYKIQQAKLAETDRQNRLKFGISGDTGSDMPTHYAALAAATAPAAPAHHAAPPRLQYKTTVHKGLSLAAWKDAKDRLGLSAWLMQIAFYSRKSHANEPDCDAWTTIDNLPEKVHAFAVQAIIEKLTKGGDDTEWARVKLTSLASELNVQQMELLPLPAVVDCLRGCCYSRVINQLQDEIVGHAALMKLQISNNSVTSYRHIEKLDEQFQQKVQAFEDILSEMEHSQDAEHHATIAEFKGKIKCRDIARHIVKEILRLVDLKHHATAFYEVADECKTFKEISALLKLAMDKSRTLQGSSKPEPSANSANADDSSLAASDAWVQQKGSARNAAHAASKSTGKSKDAVAVAALLKSKTAWNHHERALVIKVRGQAATFSRSTNLCPSCNGDTCERNVKCDKSKGAYKGYKRYLAQSGGTADTSDAPKAKHRAPRDTSSGDNRGTREKVDAPCHDFSQGRCRFGKSCKYNHVTDSANNATGGGTSVDWRKKYDEQVEGARAVTQLLCLKDPEFAKKASAKLGRSLEEQGIAFACTLSASHAADH